MLLMVVVAECLSTLAQKELELACEDREMAEPMEVPEVLWAALLGSKAADRDRLRIGSLGSRGTC